MNAYTSDWVVVRRKYHHHSSSIRPIDDLDVCLKEPLPEQEFEIDDSPDASPNYEQVSVNKSVQFHKFLLLHFNVYLSKDYAEA